MKNKDFLLKLRLPTKKRWLKNWWQKNINTFLYAIENPEIKREIENWRKWWINGETSTDPKRLYKILRQMFLKEAEIRWENKPLSWYNCPVKKENGEYYAYATSGKITKWHIENPFEIFDKEIAVPQAKMKLLEMLSNIHKNKNRWILEPRLFVREDQGDKLIYPSSNILISTLHTFGFLTPIKFWILRRLNLDYFVFWPVFFFYALTNNLEYTIKNASVLIYPIRLFLVNEGVSSQNYLLFRLYGDCNFNEIFNFIKDNKAKLNELNKLMGNPTISARSFRGFYVYSSKKKPKELSLELFEKYFTQKAEKDPYLKGLLREAKKSQDPAYKNAVQLKKITKEKENLIKVLKSEVKKEVKFLTKVERFDPKIKKLIDKINNSRI